MISKINDDNQSFETDYDTAYDYFDNAASAFTLISMRQLLNK